MLVALKHFALSSHNQMSFPSINCYLIFYTILIDTLLTLYLAIYSPTVNVMNYILFASMNYFESIDTLVQHGDFESHYDASDDLLIHAEVELVRGKDRSLDS